MWWLVSHHYMTFVNDWAEHIIPLKKIINTMYMTIWLWWSLPITHTSNCVCSGSSCVHGLRGVIHGITPIVGIAQWLECWTHDWKVTGLNPCRCGRRIFFSMVDFLCWLLFQYPFHPRVTAVAHKRSQSFCQKCRWQVTAKHINTLHMWLCMKWHGAWLYCVHRTCPETAAVSCGNSHAST